MWTLSTILSKQASLLQVEQNYEPTDERRGEISSLSFKSRALQIIFWIGIHDELELWATGGQMGLREGWKVVSFTPKATLMGFPLDYFGGPPE